MAGGNEVNIQCTRMLSVNAPKSKSQPRRHSKARCHYNVHAMPTLRQPRQDRHNFKLEHVPNNSPIVGPDGRHATSNKGAPHKLRCQSNPKSRTMRMGNPSSFGLGGKSKLMTDGDPNYPNYLGSRVLGKVMEVKGDDW